MVRILLILVTVAAINSLAWGINFYDAATDMGRANWSPVARRATTVGGNTSRIILKPYRWISGHSPSVLAFACTIFLEAAIIEGALRLYQVEVKSE